MYSNPHNPASSDPASQTVVIARLVQTGGYRAEAIAQAITLLQTGAVDVIEQVLAGRISIERALKIVRQRRSRS
jgi:hypothetical protein